MKDADFKMRKPKYRLSPNEVERLVKEERERLRKLRIVQVREQAKANAALIRNQVKSEKERLLADFANEVKHEVLAEKDEKIRKLEQKYDSTLRSIGEGHAEVLLNGDGQKIAERLHKRFEDEERAMERYKAAKEKHDRDKAQEEWEASRNVRNRNLALEVESKRAAYIAALPPPTSDDISFDDKPTQKKAIPMTDMKSFAATHYHIPDYQVIKAGPDEQLYDAKVDAEQADKRLKQDLKEKKVAHHEQVEKARIRGNEALHKEMLKHDLSDMMKDLSLLQRKDRRRRQALLAEVPNQVFIPPERCLQDRADQQLEMERQFEEMYMDKQQKPDASTLQTWSELPAGDDAATNEDSEMSTLESVPLPPSEMALRDFTGPSAAVSKKQPQPSDGQRVVGSRKPDTVLKQLLNKIKEQRLNVSAHQKQDPRNALSTNERTGGKDADAASLTSASESRASWKRSTENMDEESLDDIPVKGHAMNGMEADAKSVDSGDTKSSGSKFLDENNALIEELQQRIQKIENQKVVLAQQLHSQSEFYQELQRQQQELQNLRLLPKQNPVAAKEASDNYDHDSEPTLEDVSIPSREDSQFELNTSCSNFTKPSTQGNAKNLTKTTRDVQILPTAKAVEEMRDQSVDLANAMSKLRPVAGILKGAKNPQFELLASNGFLPPSLEYENMLSNADRDVEKDLSRAGGKGVEVLKENEINRNILQLDSVNLIKEGGGGGGGGARRMIDFGGGDLKKTESSLGNLSNRSDKISNNQVSTTAFDSRGGLEVMDDPMRRKIQDYHSRAQELHASMDESTLNKVRDYQQHILQTHQDRKQLLESIRDDIEQRRQALYTSKFVGTGGAFLMNLGSGAGSNIPAASSARGQVSLPPSTSFSSLMMPSSSYPMLSSGVDSTKPFLSHSQSEKVLEPIKPFIADPWIRDQKKQPSILKPSTEFQGQYDDLSKVGLSQNRALANQGGKQPTSSIERIKKSLAFDDLNESNIDASPAFYRGGDSLNDTSASRHSQALTDDSKLTTSEEDRGSPILQGSRSDNWDTSDKSNNSVTGSSSLNGSALVARAEERREGFERRQQELRNQLMDIQQQKEAILMRYYKGQQAIQEQQNVMRNKLLFPNPSTNSSSSLGQHLPQTDTLHQGENWSLKLTRFQPGSGSDAGSGSGIGRLSGKSSRSSSNGSGRESLNLTGDDYLEDISYHQVKGTDEPTVPLQLPDPSSLSTTSATSWSNYSQGQRSRVGRGGGGGVTFADEERGKRFMNYADSDEDDDDENTQLKEQVSRTSAGTGTWASVLSSGEPAISSFNLPISSTSSSGLSQPLNLGLEESSSGDFRNDFAEMSTSSAVGSNDELTSSSSLSSQFPGHELLYHHQPHELSTIMEVDTPTATNSVAGSSIRLAPPSASQSLQSLYSQGSGAPLHPYNIEFENDGSKSFDNEKIVMDHFPDLPHVLPVTAPSSSSASLSHQGLSRGFNLATGGRISPMTTASDGLEYHSSDVRGEGDGITLSEVSLGAGSSCYTLESEPADVESNLETSGGFNLSQ